MSASEKKHKLFVYGTTKRGQYFHDSHLSHCAFSGIGRTSLDYTLYVDALPFLVRESSDNSVKGELFDVDNETLKELDLLEGHPRVYKREMIEVMDENNNVVTAWAYLYPNIFKGKRHVLKEYEWE